MVTVAAIAALGLVVGSFLNVVVARLPHRRSLWGPRSACPACGAAIAWHDNIPVLSFVALRGRCRACEAPIAWRYPLIEALTAGTFALAHLVLGLSPALVPALLLLAALIAITFIDLEHELIPDAITLPGVVTGLVANVATGAVPWLDSVIGAIVAGGGFFAIIVASGGGMGGGDMKLGAMLGSFLGWQLTIVALFLAVVAGGGGALAVLSTGKKGRKDPIPFGPFLALGGAAALLWGRSLMAWYFDVFVS
ncbi:MAG: prepilin peptidase [Candidatus Rokubacteria bacterium]|nr:prepilin peptidase [Candidatus Rokubacteria bacterium]